MERLINEINKFKGKRILVIGDLMLDKYIFGDVSRISPEAPIPVVHENHSEYVLGGACNVANNIKALGGEPILAGTIGKDNEGKIIGELLAKNDIKEVILVETKKPTVKKTRVISRNQQMIRLDFEDSTWIDQETQNKIYEKITKLKDIDAIIFEDYHKGLLADDLCKRLVSHFKQKKILMLVDPKKEYEKFKGVDIFKPNIHELKSITGQEDLTKACSVLYNKLNCKYLFVTKGKEGMFIYDGELVHVPTNPIEVVDITGAGDTAIASLSLSFSIGLSAKDSGIVANHSSSVVVQKLGTATVTLNELKNSFSKTNRKLKTRDELVEVVKNLKLQNKKIVWTNGCFDLMHPGHIKLLKEAKTHGDILIVGLNTDASVKRYKGPSRPILNENERAEVMSSLEFVDYVMFFDEDTPEKSIKMLKPDVHVKGGDWKIEDLPEAKIVKSYGGKVVIVKPVEGKSTTNIIKKIKDT